MSHEVVIIVLFDFLEYLQNDNCKNELKCMYNFVKTRMILIKRTLQRQFSVFSLSMIGWDMILITFK